MHSSFIVAFFLAICLALCSNVNAQTEPPIHQAILDNDDHAILENLDDPDVVGSNGMRPLYGVLTPDVRETLQEDVRVDVLTKLLGEDGASLWLDDYEGYQAAVFAFGPPYAFEELISEIAFEAWDNWDANKSWDMPFYMVSDFFDPYFESNVMMECSPFGFAMLGVLLSEADTQSLREADENITIIFDYFEPDEMELDEVCRFHTLPRGLKTADGKISVYDWMAYAGGIYGTGAGLQAMQDALNDEIGFDNLKFDEALTRYSSVNEAMTASPERVAQIARDDAYSRYGVSEQAQQASQSGGAAVARIDQTVIRSFRDRISESVRPKLQPKTNYGSSEPAIHKAIMDGDLRQFRAALNDPRAEGVAPRKITPYVRLLSREVQNSVPPDVRTQMLRDLISAGGDKRADRFTNKLIFPNDYISHLLSFGPPELVREELRKLSAEAIGPNGPGELKLNNLSSQYPVIYEVSDFEHTRRHTYDASAMMKCSAAGAIALGLAQSRAGENAYHESRENLLSLFELVPYEVIMSGPACVYSSSPRLDELQKMEFSFLELITYAVGAFGDDTVRNEGLGILQELGVLQPTDLPAITDKLNPAWRALAQFRSEVRAEQAFRAQLAAAPVDRREPDIHKALLRADVAGVKARLHQANMPGVSPPGIKPIYRVLTPRVQNVLTPPEQTDLLMDIFENLSTYDDEIVFALLAAYGSADQFKSVLTTDTLVARSKGMSKPVNKQFHMLSIEVGQDAYGEFGKTYDTCPPLMHVYFSLMSAPEHSTQLSEAKKKLVGLFKGRFGRFPEGVKTDSDTLGDPEQSCFFYQLKPNPMKPNGIEQLVRSRPNVYTELEKDLNIPARRERAEWVIETLIELGLFKEDAIARWSEIDRQRQKNLAAHNRQEAETLARSEAYAQQMNNQSIAAGLSGGISALDQQLRNTPEARHAELERRAGEEAERRSRQNAQAGGDGTIGTFTLKDGQFDLNRDEGFKDNSGEIDLNQYDQGAYESAQVSSFYCKGIDRSAYVGRSLPECDRAGNVVVPSKEYQGGGGNAIKN